MQRDHTAALSVKNSHSLHHHHVALAAVFAGFFHVHHFQLDAGDTAGDGDSEKCHGWHGR